MGDKWMELHANALLLLYDPAIGVVLEVLERIFWIFTRRDE